MPGPPRSTPTGAIPADGDHDIPQPVVDLADQLLRAPRHLGIHSGGMVLTERPVGEVCPIERGRMDHRTVLQWDKDSCAWMGLVKFDFLGLGMLAAHPVHASISSRTASASAGACTPFPRRSRASTTCSAGRTRSECSRSRAGRRSARCPRLLPRQFYDLVVEIGLIRPGPIQGGAVHPYIRRAHRPGEDHLPAPDARAGAESAPRASRCSRSS